MPYLEEESLAVDRMGARHTEGLGDSWANIYLWIAQAIGAIQAMKAVGTDMDKVVIAGIGATQDAPQAMKEGDLDVIVFQVCRNRRSCVHRLS